jgi:glutathione S-transferase
MITLYTFGAAYGLPDMSPFVTKAEMLLKLAGLEYRTDSDGFGGAPKGKLPYIDDDGELIADSTFIRRHIEQKYGFDFDRGLDAERRAIAWAFERMFEDHVYWAFLHARWVDDANFNRGPGSYFQRMPMPMRFIVPRIARRQIKAQIRGHGMGRHSDAEIVELGTRSLDAAADFLGQKTYMMGDELSGLDATAFAFLANALSPVFETPLRTAVERHDNIKAYVGRMTDRYYPDYPEMREWAA